MRATDTQTDTAPLPDPSMTCFKAYDVRGRLGDNFDAATARRIGAAFAAVMRPRTVVVGRDCRESSSEILDALAAGLTGAGVDVLDIGLAGTEEVYFATAHLDAEGGIEVTASHNPIDYNGLKIVGPGSRPLSEEEFDAIKGAAQAGAAGDHGGSAGSRQPAAVRDAYARHLVDMVAVDRLRPVRLVVNAGNGVAGPAFDAILDELERRGAPVTVTRLHHAPDGRFPNGIPNPLLEENRPVTAEAVLREGADLGIAWDGDFDRCFFFTHEGGFVDGEYVVALLAEACLATAPGETIVHDPRVIWNTQDTVSRAGGVAVQSRTGHAFMKRVMRAHGAIYGGEMSAHHYFRDFMYCDSGMIPWLKIWELVSRREQPLAALIDSMKARFPSSGEINFEVPDPKKVIERVAAHFEQEGAEIAHFDGVSITFPDWRASLRASSTEPLMRLNVEARGAAGQVRHGVDRVRATIDAATG